jgi:hypothetical protein
MASAPANMNRQVDNIIVFYFISFPLNDDKFKYLFPNLFAPLGSL